MGGFVLVIHRCKNFSEWKKGFAIDLSERTAATLTELNLMQSTSDPNEVVILFKAGDFAKVKTFMESPSLKAHMEKCGVIGKPTVHILQTAK